MFQHHSVFKTNTWLILFLFVASFNVNAQLVTKINKNYKSISKEVKVLNTQLDKNKISVDSLNVTLEKLFVLRDTILSNQDELNKELKKTNENLIKLGPVPEEDAEEAESVTIQRKELTERETRVTSAINSLDILLIDVDGIINRVSKLKRSDFLTNLKARTDSVFSKDLWTVTGSELKRILGELNDYIVSFWKGFWSEKDWLLNLILLKLSLFLGIIILKFPNSTVWKKLEAYLITIKNKDDYDEKEDEDLEALGKPLIYALLTFLACWIFYIGLSEVGFIKPESDSFFVRLIVVTASFVFIRKFAFTKFKTGNTILFNIMPREGKFSKTRNLFIGIFIVFFIDRTLAAAFQYFNAETGLIMAQAVFFCFLFSVLLFQFARVNNWTVKDVDSTEIDGLKLKNAIENFDLSENTSLSKTKKEILLLELSHAFLRGLSIFLISISLLGFIRLADFIFHRIVLLTLFVIFFYAFRVLVFWLISKLSVSKLYTEELDDSSTDTETVYENKKADAILTKFWLQSGTDVILFILAIPCFLYVIGLDWLDVSHWFNIAITGFSIGAVTISIKNIISGVFIFFAIVLFTKWLTQRLNNSFEKINHVNSGVNTSITTIITYIGYIIAFLAALPVLGLSFSRLTVVAGALSVGIGFGLRNIVNDFVCGLILLFDRSIKIGDLIILPSGEGKVEKINARSTVVRQFDLSALIVPNSELVTTSFLNWYYKNKNGRLEFTVNVDYGSDIQLVKRVLLECINEYSDLMIKPNPYVLWKDYGDSSLHFELRGHFRNHGHIFDTKNELRQKVFDRFKEEGISIPFPQRDIHVRTNTNETNYVNKSSE